MIISLRSLSYADLKKQLNPGDKVVINGCDQCVKACGIGGPEMMQKLTDLLTQDGFKIIGQDLLGCGCMVVEIEEHKRLKNMYNDATAIISLICEDGQPIVEHVFSNKKVIGTAKTLGTGNLTMDRGAVLTRPFEDTGLAANPEGYDLADVAEKLQLYASFFDEDEVIEETREHVNITVNGKKISAVKGQNLLSVCLSNDIDIPHLCHHVTISESGSCRLCVVKLKGEENPVASCCTQAEEGMEIITEDDELNSYRRTILELMIASGDHNCLTCTKGVPSPMASCELQALVREYGIDTVRFEKEKELPTPDASTPIIYYDPKRCIGCGRCVCASREISGLSVLSLAKRGEMIVPVPGAGGQWADSQCDGCMACVWVCPTGALNETVVRFSGPEWTPERKYMVLPS